MAFAKVAWLVCRLVSKMAVRMDDWTVGKVVVL